MLKPSEALATKVEPAYADHLASPTNKRLANILAAALTEQAEWTFQYYEMNDSSRLMGAKDLECFKRLLIQKCPALHLMRDLADAARHRFLTRKVKPPRAVAASTAAYSLQGDELSVAASEESFPKLAEAAVTFWRHWQD